MPSHILSMSQITERIALEAEITRYEGIIQQVVERQFGRFSNKFAHLLFYENSTRTRISFYVAAKMLGMETVTVSGAEGSSVMKGECLSDSCMTHAALMADIIIVRTPYEGGPRFAAEFLQRAGHKISVINAGDGKNQHPSQCRLDLLTIKRKLGRLDNFTIGIVGDLKYGRTSHSLLQALTLFDNIKVVLVAPPEAKMPDEYKKGVNIIYEGTDLRELRQCNIVYMTRPQLERIEDPLEKERLKAAIRITEDVLDMLPPDTDIMHPLPCIDEIDPAIKLNPRFIAYMQVANGIPARIDMVRSGITAYEPLVLEFPFEAVGGMDTKPTDASSKKAKYFRPMDAGEIGAVIDHVPMQHLSRVLPILRYFGYTNKTCDIITASGPSIHSRVFESGCKAVILIRGKRLMAEVGAELRFALPSITITDFPGTSDCHKMQYNVPSVLHFFPCPNPTCITNNDRNATPLFHVTDEGKLVVCHYCERHFAPLEVTRMY